VHLRKFIIATLVVVAGQAVRAADPVEAESTRAADPVDAAAARAAADYAERLKIATNDLLIARERITAARTPLAEATRSAETRIAMLEGELLQLETTHGKSAETREQLRRENDEVARTFGYLLNQAQETMKLMEDSMQPGERPAWAERIDLLRSDLDSAAAQNGVPAALAVADFAADRTAREIGGFTVAGPAVAEGDNRVLAGTFLFLGPATYFQADGAGPTGIVNLRPNSGWAVVQTVANWTPAAAGPLFHQGRGLVALAASGGKALALNKASVSLLEQMRRGGAVTVAIVAVGILALIITIQKLFDFRRLAVDEPAAVRPVLAHLARGEFREATDAARKLKTTTRDLFILGIQHRLKSKALLEEYLESFVLEQRMLQERRLPLLAVIATSGPLLGLLGTVAGMIKTFTLITVLGTGSAGKLSAGISEALISTKFGLIVAIPALVIHGFLSHRIQKHLALLDRYALEIATACEESQRSVRPEETSRP
jgi:biopolymer transport protein ExbB